MSTLVSGFSNFDAVDFDVDSGRLGTILNMQRVLMSACQVEELEPDVVFLVTELALVDEVMEAVENFKGSRDEKLVVLYCKQLGINYKNLSDEEFRWLIRILKKSKKMGTPISQRKKR